MHCRPRRLTNVEARDVHLPATHLMQSCPLQEVEKMLDTIHNITVQGMNTTCISQQYHSVALPVRYDHLESVRQKADMLARVLLDVGKLDNRGKRSFDIDPDATCRLTPPSNVSSCADLLEMLILNLVKSDQVVEESRLMTFVDSSSSSGLSYSNVFMARVRQSNSTYREPQIELQAYGDLTTTSPISSASAASRSTSKQVGPLDSSGGRTWSRRDTRHDVYTLENVGH